MSQTGSFASQEVVDTDKDESFGTEQPTSSRSTSPGNLRVDTQGSKQTTQDHAEASNYTATVQKEQSTNLPPMESTQEQIWETISNPPSIPSRKTVHKDAGSLNTGHANLNAGSKDQSKLSINQSNTEPGKTCQREQSPERGEAAPREGGELKLGIIKIKEHEEI